MLDNQNLLRKRDLNGETIEFQDLNDSHFEIWFQPRTAHFCLMMNAKVIKATKTWKPIEDKLSGFAGVIESFNDAELF